MSDASTRRECPRCGSTLVVKNGPRDGRQQYLCRTHGCELQFIDRKEPYFQRFIAELIARAIELRLEGMQYKEVGAEVRHEFSISGTKISAKTVLCWVQKYVNIAFQDVRKLPIKTPEILVVEYASLYPDGAGCWVVWDFYASYVLAGTLAGSSFDPASAREVITKSEALTGLLTRKVREFTFWTDENSGNPEACSEVLEAIEEQLQGASYIRPEAIGLKSFLKLDPRGAFQQPLRTMRSQRTLRTPESRQLFLDGWVVMHNFFIEQDDLNGLTPAEKAGVKTPFLSWLDVVNHRVKVPGERPRRRQGRGADRRPAGRFGVTPYKRLPVKDRRRKSPGAGCVQGGRCRDHWKEPVERAWFSGVLSLCRTRPKWCQEMP